jgi:hypothetical protein
MPSQEMQNPRDASVDWVRRSLTEELRDDSPSVGTRAENLVAIAEHYQMPVDVLIMWIHANVKQCSAADFRRFCVYWKDRPAQDSLFNKLPEAF